MGLYVLGMVELNGRAVVKNQSAELAVYLNWKTIESLGFLSLKLYCFLDCQQGTRNKLTFFFDQKCLLKIFINNIILLIDFDDDENYNKFFKS